MKRNSTACIIPIQGPASPRRTDTIGRRIKLIVVVTASCLTGFTSVNSSIAYDWPQILGPNRNGIAIGEKLMDSFPAEGLNKIWSHPVGEGYSGPVVVGNRVIIFHRGKSEQWVECLSLKDGTEIWKTSLPAKYRSGGIDSDTGPKAVPLIHDDKVYLFDAAGELFCLGLNDGKTIWTRSTASDFRAPPGYFGFGSSPIAVDNTLIVNVGGNDAGVVGLDLDTGQTRWVATDQRASYSSPVAITQSGLTRVLVMTRLKFFGIDPANGDVLFEVPFGDRGPTVNGAMPLVVNDKVFLTASYGIGSKWLAPYGTSVKEIWSDSNNFESQYSTPVLLNGKLYGSSGREDHKNGSYRCLELGTGKLVWTEENVPVGHSILVNDKIVVLDHTGTLHILNATPKQFTRIYKTRLFNAPSRAIPAISNGKLLARSNFSQGKAELACFEIGQARSDE